MIKKRYKRMVELIINNNIFTKNDTFTAQQLAQELYNNNLIFRFNLFYWQDCHCEGRWTVFDFSDRFRNFTRELERIKYCTKIGNNLYKVL